MHVAGLTAGLRVHCPIPQKRKEDPSEPARERDHGDALAAPGRDADSPLPQCRCAGIAEAEHGDGGLDQQPPHPSPLW